MKNLKYLNEERISVKDTAERVVTRGYPHLEMLRTRRSREPKDDALVVPKHVNIDGSIVYRS